MTDRPVNSREDLNAKTEAGHKLLARYRTEGRQLFQRATIATGPDGYPRQASGADPTIPSDAPTSLQERSEDGRAISYSDPTGDRVTGRRERDPVRAEAYRAMKHLDKALEHLEAGAAIFDYQKHILGQATAAGDEDRWCQSCRRDHGYAQPVLAGRYAKYCSWCGIFYAKYRQEPPLELLAKLHADQRIYDRDIVQALKASKGRKAG
jgi:hypothetical protein